MGKILRFNKKPELVDLEGLTVNGGSFKYGKGIIAKADTILMSIPDTFRFSTYLEIFEYEGHHEMIMTQFLTRGADYWEMEDAFSRIGFRDPEIEEQMRLMCDELIDKGIAKWVEEL